MQTQACHLFGAKPLFEPKVVYCRLDTEQTPMHNGDQYVLVSMCQRKPTYQQQFPLRFNTHMYAYIDPYIWHVNQIDI